MDDPHGTANSSAYSSLANSNGDVRTDASASPDIPASTGTTSILPLPASKMQGVEVTSAEEIRRIIDDYNQTLAKATAKIKSLTKERNNLEVDYEKLMTLNEGIATDLEKTVRYKRRLEEEHEAVLKANDELFEEAQRLNDEESVWIEDKETLEAELKRLRSEVEDLRRNEAEREAGERLADKTIRQMDELKAEKDELADTVTKLEIDSKKLSKELQRVEKEKDNILSRKEMVTGENMQLIMEAEEFHAVKADLTNQLRTAQNRIRELQKENSSIKFEYDSKMVDDQADRYAALVEKNKNLSDWREQLIEKNRVLTDENKKLAQRCTHLEELLSEEETDINVVLDMIKTVQRPSIGSGVVTGPDQKQSFIGAKAHKGGMYK